MTSENTTDTTRKITVWARQKVAHPKLGAMMHDPLAWMTDEYGAALSSYDEPLPAIGEIIKIGAHHDGAYWVAVEVEVSERLAGLIDPADIAD